MNKIWEWGADGFFIEADQADLLIKSSLFQKLKIEPPYTRKVATPFWLIELYPWPPLASSPNISTSSPGLNVEIVGGPSMLVVMDGSWEDYSEDLQLREPVLEGRSESHQIIGLFLSLQLADNTPTFLHFHSTAGELLPNTCFLTDRNVFLLLFFSFCKEPWVHMIWKQHAQLGWKS